MPLSEYLPLGGFLLACLTAAFSGAFFKPGQWYEDLNHPPWRPPNWLFPPAWGLLFVLIAMSGWMVWRQVGFGWPIALWGVSLLINAGWSWLFFGLRRPDWGFGNLVTLWLSILAMIVVFDPIDHLAAWLLAPYIAWVTFAGALNLAILRRNPIRSRPRLA